MTANEKVKSISSTNLSKSTSFISNKNETSSFLGSTHLKDAFSNQSVLSRKTKLKTKKKPNNQVGDMCDCGPDFYGRMFGSTADETLLAGLIALIELCNKLNVCSENKCEEDTQQFKEETTDKFDDKKNSLQHIPEKDVLPTAHSQTDERDIKTVNSQTDNKALKESKSQTYRNMVSAGFQVNPAVKHKSVQTLPITEMVSELLQTIGLTPELLDKMIQTSKIEPIFEKKPSLLSGFMQTSHLNVHSGMVQTLDPELRVGIVQTSDQLLPKLPEFIPLPPPPPPPPIHTDSVMTQSDEVRTASKLTMSNTPITKASGSSPLPNTSTSTQSDHIPTLSKQTIVNKSSSSMKSVRIPTRPSLESHVIPKLSKLSPKKISKQTVEPEHIIEQQKTYPLQAAKGDEHNCITTPELPPKLCKCCKCSSSSALPDSEDSNKREKYNCICNSKKKQKCSCSSPSNTNPSSNTSFVKDPQLGLEVRYSITRITKYKEFTTFEVLKSTSHLPKHIPKAIEGIFVLKKEAESKNGFSKH